MRRVLDFLSSIKDRISQARQPEPLLEPSELPDGTPPAHELPKGYRLRRVGPYEWVAEPHSRRLYVWTLVVAAAILASAVTAVAVRREYRRRASYPIVVVNGEPISRESFRTYLEQRFGRPTMRQLVADTLLRQFAQSRDCWPTDEEVEERYRTESAEAGFFEELARQNLTEAEYRDRLRYRLAEVKLLVRGIEVNEAEVRYFYERNIDPRNPNARFRRPPRIQVAVIATRTEEAARKAARDLADRVPWPQVVTRYSVHASRRDAGLLPPLVRGKSLFSRYPGAEEQVFKLWEGDRSTPFKAGGLWWIVRCIRKWPAEVVPYEEARKDAEMGARIEKAVATNLDKLARERTRFISQANIQVLDPAYDEVARPIVSSPSLAY